MNLGELDGVGEGVAGGADADGGVGVGHGIGEDGHAAAGEGVEFLAGDDGGLLAEGVARRSAKAGSLSQRRRVVSSMPASREARARVGAAAMTGRAACWRKVRSERSSWSASPSLAMGRSFDGLRTSGES